MLGEFGDDAKILAGGQSLVPMLAMRLTYFENLIDISRDRRTEEHRAARRRAVGRGRHAARAGRDGRRGGRIGAAADAVDALHRPLPDPDQGHAGRRDRARRPRRGVRRGRARARRDDGGDVVAGPTARSRRPSSSPACGRRRWHADEILTAVRFPVWGGPVRLRGRGIRQAPRRFRDRGRDGRGGARRRRPGGAVRNRTARARVDTAARLGGRGRRRRPARRCRHRRRGRQARDERARPRFPPTFRARPTTDPAWVPRWWRGRGPRRSGEAQTSKRRRSMHELPVELTVNGRAHRHVVEPRLTLADFLREKCGLTGTHLGCEHGACGACTVLLDGQAVRACLIFAVQVDGQEVTTVEGIAGERRRAVTGAVRAARVPRPAMRLLHTGFRHVDHRAAARQSAADRRGDPRRPIRQLLPVHRLPGHHQRGAPRRRVARPLKS